MNYPFILSQALLFSLFLFSSAMHAQIKTLSGAQLQASEIDEFLEKKMEAFHMPGLSIAIVNDGEIVYHRVMGSTHAESQEPITHNTLFEGASITKPVFAYLVMKLVQEGRLDLDRPLYLYKPYEDIAYDERYKQITARIVLTHGTGFPNWRYENKGQELDIRFDPGTKFSYSGEGFVYLSRVVEHICQQSIDQLLQTEVFEPLGMTDTHMMIAAGSEEEERHAFGHFDGQPSGGIWKPKLPNVASSIRSEAADFSRFLIEMMDGQLLDSFWMNQMLSTQVEIPDDHIFFTLLDIKAFGYGFAIEPTPYGQVVAHGGNNGDFQSYFQVDRERKIGYVFFTNSNRAFNYETRAETPDFSQELEAFLHSGGVSP